MDSAFSEVPTSPWAASALSTPWLSCMSAHLGLVPWERSGHFADEELNSNKLKQLLS